MTEENKRLGHCCIHFSFCQDGGNPEPPEAPFFLLVCRCLNKWALTCHVLSGAGEVPIISVPWALGPEGNGAREVDTSTKIRQRCRLWLELWWHNSLSVSVSWSCNAGITVIWPLSVSKCDTKDVWVSASLSPESEICCDKKDLTIHYNVCMISTHFVADLCNHCRRSKERLNVNHSLVLLSQTHAGTHCEHIVSTCSICMIIAMDKECCLTAVQLALISG